MSFVDRRIIIQLDRLTLRPKTSLKSLKAQHSWAAWCNQSIKITWHCWRLPIWPLVMTGHYYITLVLIVHFILRIHQLESGKGEDIQIHEHARSTTSKTKMQEFRIVIEIWRPLLLLRQHLWALYKETPSTWCNTHNFKQATIMLGGTVSHICYNYPTLPLLLSGAKLKRCTTTSPDRIIDTPLSPNSCLKWMCPCFPHPQLGHLQPQWHHLDPRSCCLPSYLSHSQ